MEIKYYKQFARNLKLRIKPNPGLFDRYKERTRLFITDSANPILKDHGLKGEKEKFRAFSITGDIRVIYYQGKNYIYFIDIGTHEEVY